jgi:hypothetical protein
MKNKTDPALSGGSYIFNEIIKRTTKSRETIPLTFAVKSNLELLILELLPFGRFFSH